MLSDAEVRLPGTRRFHLADQAMESGFDLPDALIAQIQAIA